MKSNLLASILLICCCGSVVLVAQDYPRVETFLGYTFTRANAGPSNFPAFSLNGGSGQVAVNASRAFGFVMDLGAVHNGNIGGFNTDTTISNFLFGPRVSMRHSRVRPYLQVLFGGAHLGTSTRVGTLLSGAGAPIIPPGTRDPIIPGQPVTARLNASQTAFAMTAGGGLDIKINKWVSFRPIGLDYFLTRFQNFRTGSDNNQNNLRYTAGFNFTFGGEHAAPAPPPVTTKNCPGGFTVSINEDCPKRDITLALNVSKSDVCAGETVTVTPSAGLPDGAILQWTINGEPASQTATLDFLTAGRTPGSYKVGLKASAEGYNDGLAETSVTVLEYRPPSGTLQASPSEIWVGEKATLSANFSPGQCGGALKPATFTASEGSVSGNEYDSSSVQFDPSNNSEKRKTVEIATNVADD